MRKFSSYCLSILIILFSAFLIIFSTSNIQAVHYSLDLFLNAIFPGLFPFLIATELLSYTFVFSFLKANFGKIMKPLFNVDNIGAYPFVISLFSGYPVGARIVSDLRNQNLISKHDGDLLLIVTNNASPIFLISSIGIGIYGSIKIGILLYIVHIISSIISGFVFSKILSSHFRDIGLDSLHSIDVSSFGTLISDAIKKSFYTLSTVCGFIILFSLVISMIQTSGIISFIKPLWIQSMILGIIEITNGINLISTLPYSLFFKLLLTSFLLGSGGLSVLLQVWSVISNSDLSIKSYVLGKIFNAFLSFFIFMLFYQIL